jgi:hypothetical protein
MSWRIRESDWSLDANQWIRSINDGIQEPLPFAHVVISRSDVSTCHRGVEALAQRRPSMILPIARTTAPVLIIDIYRQYIHCHILLWDPYIILYRPSGWNKWWLVVLMLMLLIICWLTDVYLLNCVLFRVWRDILSSKRSQELFSPIEASASSWQMYISMKANHPTNCKENSGKFTSGHVPCLFCSPAKYI